MSGPPIVGLLFGVRALVFALPLALLALAMFVVAIVSLFSWGSGREHALQILKQLARVLTAFRPQAGGG